MAQKEQLNGNKSITQDKLDNLSRYVLEQKRRKALTAVDPPQNHKSKPLPVPVYSSLFTKFDIHKKTSLPAARTRKTSDKVPSFDPSSGSSLATIRTRSSPTAPRRIPRKKLTFKALERIVIEVLETLANLLDNLHLFSKLPMFPKPLLNLLKQTNKLWILILVFLIRKTISQLLNVIRKQRKVEAELDIVRENGSKLLEGGRDDGNIFKRYEKVLKDLAFDKMMLKIELVGNFLDLAFNMIEFYGWAVPDWFMSGLNVASMFMTIYRMNKDDEYVDDDVSEDLL